MISNLDDVRIKIFFLTGNCGSVEDWTVIYSQSNHGLKDNLFDLLILICYLLVLNVWSFESLESLWICEDSVQAETNVELLFHVCWVCMHTCVVLPERHRAYRNSWSRWWQSWIHRCTLPQAGSPTWGHTSSRTYTLTSLHARPRL